LLAAMYSPENSAFSIQESCTLIVPRLPAAVIFEVVGLPLAPAAVVGEAPLAALVPLAPLAPLELLELPHAARSAGRPAPMAATLKPVTPPRRSKVRRSICWFIFTL
jgi:hypothetical protein